MALDALPAVHIGTLSARTNDVKRPIVAGPLGTKMVATVTGGTFVGPKINAHLAGRGGGGRLGDPMPTAAFRSMCGSRFRPTMAPISM